jgi:hypothetical protein
MKADNVGFRAQGGHSHVDADLSVRAATIAARAMLFRHEQAGAHRRFVTHVYSMTIK